MRPLFTPSSYVTVRRVSACGEPYGASKKSSSISFGLGAWSLATVSIVPSWMPCHSPSLSSAVRMGGPILAWGPSLCRTFSVRARYWGQVSAYTTCPFSFARWMGASPLVGVTCAMYIAQPATSAKAMARLMASASSTSGRVRVKTSIAESFMRLYLSCK